MRRLEVADSAREDLIGIEGFWGGRPDLVADFYAAFRRAAVILVDTPGAGTPVNAASLRKWRIKPTPFLILYRATRSSIRIVRIVHERRNWRPGL